MQWIKNISERCVGCGQCALVCEVDAIQMHWGEVVLDNQICILCETCIDYCPVEALALEEDEVA